MANSGKFNKLDTPLTTVSELADQVDWTEYEYAHTFEYLCEVHAVKKDEKLVIAQCNKRRMCDSCVYIMVLQGKIFKIGTALRGIKARISSYNTGKTKYRVRGTNSGSNYWCLQSFIHMNVPIICYTFFPTTRRCHIFGEEVDEPFPSAKTIEGVIIRQFYKKYTIKPLGCTQS